MNFTRHLDATRAIRLLAMQSRLAFAALLALPLLFSAAAPAQTFSLLYQFRSGAGGLNPYAGVVLDASGNLYGTTVNDGAFAAGTVFEVNPVGKERVLHSFTGLNGDGASPWYGGLVRDSSGNLYGTTESGGIFDQFCLFGCGTVFKVTPSGSESIVYSFTGTGGDGSMPFFGLARDASGNLYGSNLFSGSFGVGNVYKVDPTGKETVLYSFTGSTDGGIPDGAVLADAKGNVYGTTSIGGSNFLGTVFKVTPSGTETVLYNFAGNFGGTDGASPLAGLIRDSAGNFYGTTGSGGTAGLGTVYKVTLQGQETVLHNFTGGSDGQNPADASLVRDSAGNLYGVTPSGGASNFGVVFKIDASGNETILHTFSGTDGKIPYGTLALDQSGNLYGTCYEGGAFGGGVVFKIAP